MADSILPSARDDAGGAGDASTIAGETLASAPLIAGSALPEARPVPAPDRPNIPEALREPTRRVSLGFILLLCLANVALWFSMSPVSGYLLPQQVTLFDPQHDVQNLGRILGLGAFVSIFANAFAGALSDRTTSRFGRRRPWLVVCALLTAGCLALLANAPGVGALFAGWALYQLFANGMLAALVAVAPDRVPVRQRGLASAFIGLSLPLALVLGAVLLGIVVKGIATGYYILIGSLLVVMLGFALLLPDPPLPRGALPPFRLGRFLASFWIDPRRHPDFGLAWLTRFLVIFSYSAAVGNFLLYFIRDAVHYERLFPGHQAKEGVALVQLISVALLVVSSILGGVLSDRLQRRKIFVSVSALIIACALALLVFLHSWPAALVAGGVLGFGFGAFLAIDLALMTEVLPSAHDRGKDLGVLNIANALPQSVAPLAASAILVATGNNYSIVFAVAAFSAIAGGLLAQAIRSVR